MRWPRPPPIPDRSINVDDVSRDLRFMGDYGERPANSDERAALAVPLKHGNRVEAVFSLSRADPIPFTERQVAWRRISPTRR